MSFQGVRDGVRASICGKRVWISRLMAGSGHFADAVSALIFYAVPLATESGEVMFPLIVGWLVLGALVCTLALRFINVRGFMHGFQLLRGDYNHHHHSAGGEVSHFQAFTSAVSGTVGLGNIAGVAVAITLGGPGATLWMILAGVLGMSAKFAECTLGVKYRRQHANGSVSGGPMYYLTRGLSEEYPRLRWLGWLLAIIFAICTMMGAIGAGGMFQSNQAYAQIVAVKRRARELVMRFMGIWRRDGNADRDCDPGRHHPDWSCHGKAGAGHGGALCSGVLGRDRGKHRKRTCGSGCHHRRCIYG